MPDEKKILENGRKLLEEFSEALEGVQDSGETHYAVDLKNVLRADGDGECDPDFAKKFENLAPGWDSGYLVVKKRELKDGP